MLSLKEKLALPSAKWLIFIVFILAIIGLVKLLVWLTPIAWTGVVIVIGYVVKFLIWLIPIGWNGLVIGGDFTIRSLIALVVGLGGLIYALWRWKQQRDLHRELKNGSPIIEGEYTYIN